VCLSCRQFTSESLFCLSPPRVLDALDDGSRGTQSLAGSATGSLLARVVYPGEQVTRGTRARDCPILLKTRGLLEVLEFAAYQWKSPAAELRASVWGSQAPAPEAVSEYVDSRNFRGTGIQMCRAVAA
jgi:hypothetical protein